MRYPINGLEYYVESMGQGTPVLFLHGFTGSSQNWLPLMPNFSPPFQTLAVDLLGHGQSAAPSDPQRYAMEAAAADLAALRQILVTDPVHLVGYSMGGRLALYLALFYPDRFRSVTLESASPGLADPAERQARRHSDAALADRIEKNGIAAFVEEWENLPLFASQRRLPEEVRAQRLQNNPQGLANSLRGMGSGSQPSLWEKLPELRLPALLLVGELDTKFVGIARQMHALIPNARLEIVKDAGHTIHLEQPAAFTELLLAFINRV